jgi:hypothetical protein
MINYYITDFSCKINKKYIILVFTKLTFEIQLQTKLNIKKDINYLTK